MIEHRLTGRDPADGCVRAVVIAADRIARIEEVSADTPLQGGDAAVPWLSAGLVDLQVNGYAGIDVNAAALAPAELERLADEQLAQGVTTFVPTLITDGEEPLLARLSAIDRARRGSARLAHMIPFVHVEGPFLSPADGPRGAHPEAHVRAPDLAEVARWQAACNGLVGLVTLSPHWPDTAAFIRELVAQGIHVAIGHTDATPAQIAAAVDAGATMSTHLGNGVEATLPRHPNLLWAQLAEDRLVASFIADGHHLPDDTLHAMVRSKGAGRCLLVSDTVALGGLAAGRYRTPVGGSVELSGDGRLSLAGTPYLAGAALPLQVGVANLCASGSVSLDRALDMASRVPGRLCGGRGSAEAGASADLMLFDHAPGERMLRIRQTWLRGELVFDAQASTHPGGDIPATVAR